jgi:hypothetical protein
MLLVFFPPLAKAASGAAKQRDDPRGFDAVGDYAHGDACRGHDVSVEDAEVTSLGEADLDRSLVPSDPDQVAMVQPHGAPAASAAALASGGDTR